MEAGWAGTTEAANSVEPEAGGGCTAAVTLTFTWPPDAPRFAESSTARLVTDNEPMFVGVNV